jgi:hypothetical protein
MTAATVFAVLYQHHKQQSNPVPDDTGNGCVARWAETLQLENSRFGS